MKTVALLLIAVFILAGCGPQALTASGLAAANLLPLQPGVAGSVAEGATAVSPTATDSPAAAPAATSSPVPATATATATRPPTAAPDLVATNIAALRSAAATLTAEALAVAQAQAETATPTSLPPEPAAMPAPPAASVSSATEPAVPDLVLAFTDLHYECSGGERMHYYKAEDRYYWTYRYFQVLMSITNNSNTTIEPPWKPSRWIIARWRNPEERRESSLAWEWMQVGKEWNEPAIRPGATEYWTYLALPIDRWEYVQAAEFDYGGQTYRFEFPRPDHAGVFNFVDCGNYPGGHKPSGARPEDADSPVPAGNGTLPTGRKYSGIRGE